MDVYIVNVHPLLINDSLIWDIYYLTKESSNLNCLRIYNIELSFLIAKIPSLTNEQTKDWIDMKLKTKSGLDNDYKIEMRNDLADCEYFDFDTKDRRPYFELFHRNPTMLRKMLNHLQKELIVLYGRIDDKDLREMNPSDYLFYKNTETPFRFTSTTTSLANSVYNLSTKFNVPLIGGAKFNDENFDNNYPKEILPNINGKIKGLDVSVHTIEESITKDENVDFKSNMKLLSYDIETYTIRNLNPELKENYIFSIGCGFFNLVDNIPKRSVCIISKDLNNIPDTVVVEEKQILNRKGYIISDGKDIGEYIIAEDEKDLLECFIELLEEESPQIITGFNTYGFDDEFVYKRMVLHKLENRYLQLYSYYNLEDTEQEFWFKMFKPKYDDKLALKIDNDIQRNNKTIRSWSLISTDVYKLLLKEDPKRFTQYGRGNLDTMLETYKIKNPFTGQQLTKTDMKIQEMFDLWEKNEDIYRIALYCRQDAWATGVLMIVRSKLSDLIEMANMSHTLFSDSIFRADGLRVNNTVLAYAYSEKFALKDDPYKKRSELMKGETDERLGGKIFDNRSIMGGAVRNLHPGRHAFVTAMDLSSAYPSAKEGSSIDSSSRVDEDVVNNPEKYGLKILWKKEINDMYGIRTAYGFKRL